MPNREYICDKCDYSYETWQPLHEELHKKCPKCKKKSLYQNLVGITGRVKEPKTLGQLAEQNAKKLGKYGLEAKIQQEKTSNENRQREAAAIATQRTGKKHIAKCDMPKSKIKPLDKDVKKKIFSSEGKTQSDRIEKYIRTGKV